MLNAHPLTRVDPMQELQVVRGAMLTTRLIDFRPGKIRRAAKLEARVGTVETCALQQSGRNPTDSHEGDLCNYGVPGSTF